MNQHLSIGRSMTFTLVTLSVLGLSRPFGLDAQTGTDAANAPLTVEEVVNFESFPSETPIRLSPDGEWVAYTVEYARRTTGLTSAITADGGSTVTAVGITHTATGETVRLIDAASSAWSPAWSPDGSRLAFYSNVTGAPRLWVWDRRTRRVRQVSDAIVWAAWTRNVPRWTPDGASIVVKLLPAGHTLSEVRQLARDDLAAPVSAVDGVTARVFSHESGDDEIGPATPDWLRWRYGGDLAIVAVGSGAIRRLTSGQVPVWWEASPNGTYLAFMRFADPQNLALGFRLAVVSLDDGSIRDLPGVVRQPWGEAISWSPRGDRLAYITPGEGDEGGLFLVDPKAGTRRRLTEARPGWAESFRGPVWSPKADALYFAGSSSLWAVDVTSGRTAVATEFPDHAVLDVVARRQTSTIWMPDGRVAIRVRHGETRKMGFARIDLSSGEVEELVEEEGVFGGPVNTDVSPSGSLAVVLYSDTRNAPDLWSMDGDLRRSRRLTELNPGFRPDRLGVSRLVEWRTDAGERLGGTLLLPPDYEPGTRLPMIVDVYGGDMASREIHRFDRHRQLLAARGYAVLAPDVPLNTGTPMRDHVRAVLPGLERVIELGIADADRIGVTGHSYGGYGTLALLTQTDRFKAAAASASHGSMVGMFANLRPDGSSSTMWAERGQGRMGGTPWEVRERYIENSPFFFLDRVEAPLLLLHGAEDRNTPVYLSGQVFVALQRLDRTVVLARYEGEGHWPGSWSVANQIDYWRRIVEWFERRL